MQAELIAEPAAIKAGRAVLGRRCGCASRNIGTSTGAIPGDSGEAPTITWQLPPGFAAGPIAWPTPQRIPVAHLANFGYERETMLLTRITPPAALDASAPVAIKADVTWLVCEKECIPGEASLSLSLPVAGPGSAAAPDATSDGLLRRRAQGPAATLALGCAHAACAGSGDADVDAKGLDAGAVRSAFFFPNAETLVRHAAPQQLDVTRDGLVLRLERSALSTAAPTDAGGVLVVEEALGATTAKQAFELANVAIRPGSRASRGRIARRRCCRPRSLALIGGVILNLMPCVFPVLSIKVLALGRAGGTDRAPRCAGTGSPTRPACSRRSRPWAPCCWACAPPAPRSAGASSCSRRWPSRCWPICCSPWA